MSLNTKMLSMDEASVDFGDVLALDDYDNMVFSPKKATKSPRKPSKKAEQLKQNTSKMFEQLEQKPSKMADELEKIPSKMADELEQKPSKGDNSFDFHEQPSLEEGEWSEDSTLSECESDRLERASKLEDTLVLDDADQMVFSPKKRTAKVTPSERLKRNEERQSLPSISKLTSKSRSRDSSEGHRSSRSRGEGRSSSYRDSKRLSERKDNSRRSKDTNSQSSSRSRSRSVSHDRLSSTSSSKSASRSRDNDRRTRNSSKDIKLNRLRSDNKSKSRTRTRSRSKSRDSRLSLTLSASRSRRSEGHSSRSRGDHRRSPKDDRKSSKCSKDESQSPSRSGSQSNTHDHRRRPSDSTPKSKYSSKDDGHGSRPREESRQSSSKSRPNESPSRSRSTKTDTSRSSQRTKSSRHLSNSRSPHERIESRKCDENRRSRSPKKNRERPRSPKSSRERTNSSNNAGERSDSPRNAEERISPKEKAKVRSTSQVDHQQSLRSSSSDNKTKPKLTNKSSSMSIDSDNERSKHYSSSISSSEKKTKPKVTNSSSPMSIDSYGENSKHHSSSIPSSDKKTKQKVTNTSSPMSIDSDNERSKHYSSSISSSDKKTKQKVTNTSSPMSIDSDSERSKHYSSYISSSDKKTKPKVTRNSSPMSIDSDSESEHHSSSMSSCSDGEQPDNLPLIPSESTGDNTSVISADNKQNDSLPISKTKGKVKLNIAEAGVKKTSSLIHSVTQSVLDLVDSPISSNEHVLIKSDKTSSSCKELKDESIESPSIHRTDVSGAFKRVTPRVSPTLILPQNLADNKKCRFIIPKKRKLDDSLSPPSRDSVSCGDGVAKRLKIAKHSSAKSDNKEDRNVSLDDGAKCDIAKEPPVSLVTREPKCDRKNTASISVDKEARDFSSPNLLHNKEKDFQSRFHDNISSTISGKRGAFTSEVEATNSTRSDNSSITRPLKNQSSVASVGVAPKAHSRNARCSSLQSQSKNSTSVQSQHSSVTKNQSSPAPKSRAEDRSITSPCLGGNKMKDNDAKRKPADWVMREINRCKDLLNKRSQNDKVGTESASDVIISPRSQKGKSKEVRDKKLKEHPQSSIPQSSIRLHESIDQRSGVRCLPPSGGENLNYSSKEVNAARNESLPSNKTRSRDIIGQSSITKLFEDSSAVSDLKNDLERSKSDPETMQGDETLPAQSVTLREGDTEMQLLSDTKKPSKNRKSNVSHKTSSVDVTSRSDRLVSNTINERLVSSTISDKKDCSLSAVNHESRVQGTTSPFEPEVSLLTKSSSSEKLPGTRFGDSSSASTDIVSNLLTGKLFTIPKISSSRSESTERTFKNKTSDVKVSSTKPSLIQSESQNVTMFTKPADILNKLLSGVSLSTSVNSSNQATNVPVNTIAEHLKCSQETSGKPADILNKLFSGASFSSPLSSRDEIAKVSANQSIASSSSSREVSDVLSLCRSKITDREIGSNASLSRDETTSVKSLTDLADENELSMDSHSKDNLNVRDDVRNSKVETERENRKQMKGILKKTNYDSSETHEEEDVIEKPGRKKIREGRSQSHSNKSPSNKKQNKSKNGSESHEKSLSSDMTSFDCSGSVKTSRDRNKVDNPKNDRSDVSETTPSEMDRNKHSFGIHGDQINKERGDESLKQTTREMDINKPSFDFHDDQINKEKSDELLKQLSSDPEMKKKPKNRKIGKTKNDKPKMSFDELMKIASQQTQSPVTTDNISSKNKAISANSDDKPCPKVKAVGKASKSIDVGDSSSRIKRSSVDQVDEKLTSLKTAENSDLMTNKIEKEGVEDIVPEKESELTTAVVEKSMRGKSSPKLHEKRSSKTKTKSDGKDKKSSKVKEVILRSSPRKRRPSHEDKVVESCRNEEKSSNHSTSVKISERNDKPEKHSDAKHSTSVKMSEKELVDDIVDKCKESEPTTAIVNMKGTSGPNSHDKRSSKTKTKSDSKDKKSSKVKEIVLRSSPRKRGPSFEDKVVESCRNEEKVTEKSSNHSTSVDKPEKHSEAKHSTSAKMTDRFDKQQKQSDDTCCTSTKMSETINKPEKHSNAKHSTSVKMSERFDKQQKQSDDTHSSSAKMSEKFHKQSHCDDKHSTPSKMSERKQQRLSDDTQSASAKMSEKLNKPEKHSDDKPSTSAKMSEKFDKQSHSDYKHSTTSKMSERKQQRNSDDTHKPGVDSSHHRGSTNKDQLTEGGVTRIVKQTDNSSDSKDKGNTSGKTTSASSSSDKTIPKKSPASWVLREINRCKAMLADRQSSPSTASESGGSVMTTLEKGAEKSSTNRSAGLVDDDDPKIVLQPRNVRPDHFLGLSPRDKNSNLLSSDTEDEGVYRGEGAYSDDYGARRKPLLFPSSSDVFDDDITVELDGGMTSKKFTEEESDEVFLEGEAHTTHIPVSSEPGYTTYSSISSEPGPSSLVEKGDAKTGSKLRARKGSKSAAKIYTPKPKPLKLGLRSPRSKHYCSLVSPLRITHRPSSESESSRLKYYDVHAPSPANRGLSDEDEFANILGLVRSERYKPDTPAYRMLRNRTVKRQRSQRWRRLHKNKRRLSRAKRRSSTWSKISFILTSSHDENDSEGFEIESEALPSKGQGQQTANSSSEKKTFDGQDAKGLENPHFGGRCNKQLHAAIQKVTKSKKKQRRVISSDSSSESEAESIFEVVKCSFEGDNDNDKFVSENHETKLPISGRRTSKAYDRLNKEKAGQGKTYPGLDEILSQYDQFGESSDEFEEDEKRNSSAHCLSVKTPPCDVINPIVVAFGEKNTEGKSISSRDKSENSPEMSVNSVENIENSSEYYESKTSLEMSKRSQAKSANSLGKSKKSPDSQAKLKKTRRRIMISDSSDESEVEGSHKTKSPIGKICKQKDDEISMAMGTDVNDEGSIKIHQSQSRIVSAKVLLKSPIGRKGKQKDEKRSRSKQDELDVIEIIKLVCDSDDSDEIKTGSQTLTSPSDMKSKLKNQKPKCKKAMSQVIVTLDSTIKYADENIEKQSDEIKTSSQEQSVAKTKGSRVCRISKADRLNQVEAEQKRTYPGLDEILSQYGNLNDSSDEFEEDGTQIVASRCLSVKTTADVLTVTETDDAVEATDGKLISSPENSPDMSDNSQQRIENSPENSKTSQDKSKASPGKYQGTPEKSNTSPGESENSPESSKLSPDRSENCPEIIDTGSEKTKNSPGKEEYVTEKSNKSPEHELEVSPEKVNKRSGKLKKTDGRIRKSTGQPVGKTRKNASKPPKEPLLNVPEPESENKLEPVVKNSEEKSIISPEKSENSKIGLDRSKTSPEKSKTSQEDSADNQGKSKRSPENSIKSLESTAIGSEKTKNSQEMSKYSPGKTEKNENKPEISPKKAKKNTEKPKKTGCKKGKSTGRPVGRPKKNAPKPTEEVLSNVPEPETENKLVPVVAEKIYSNDPELRLIEDALAVSALILSEGNDLGCHPRVSISPDVATKTARLATQGAGIRRRCPTPDLYNSCHALLDTVKSPIPLLSAKTPELMTSGSPIKISHVTVFKSTSRESFDSSLDLKLNMSSSDEIVSIRDLDLHAGVSVSSSIEGLTQRTESGSRVSTEDQVLEAQVVGSESGTPDEDREMKADQNRKNKDPLVETSETLDVTCNKKHRRMSSMLSKLLEEIAAHKKTKEARENEDKADGLGAESVKDKSQTTNENEQNSFENAAAQLIDNLSLSKTPVKNTPRYELRSRTPGKKVTERSRNERTPSEKVTKRSVLHKEVECTQNESTAEWNFESEIERLREGNSQGSVLTKQMECTLANDVRVTPVMSSDHIADTPSRIGSELDGGDVRQSGSSSFIIQNNVQIHSSQDNNGFVELGPKLDSEKQENVCGFAKSTFKCDSPISWNRTAFESSTPSVKDDSPSVKHSVYDEVDISKVRSGRTSKRGPGDVISVLPREINYGAPEDSKPPPKPYQKRSKVKKEFVRKRKFAKRNRNSKSEESPKNETNESRDDYDIISNSSCSTTIDVSGSSGKTDILELDKTLVNEVTESESVTTQGIPEVDVSRCQETPINIAPEVRTLSGIRLLVESKKRIVDGLKTQRLLGTQETEYLRSKKVIKKNLPEAEKKKPQNIDERRESMKINRDIVNDENEVVDQSLRQHIVARNDIPDVEPKVSVESQSNSVQSFENRTMQQRSETPTEVFATQSEYDVSTSHDVDNISVHHEEPREAMVDNHNLNISYDTAPTYTILETKCVDQPDRPLSQESTASVSVHNEDGNYINNTELVNQETFDHHSNMNHHGNSVIIGNQGLNVSHGNSNNTEIVPHGDAYQQASHSNSAYVGNQVEFGNQSAGIQGQNGQPSNVNHQINDHGDFENQNVRYQGEIPNSSGDYHQVNNVNNVVSNHGDMHAGNQEQLRNHGNVYKQYDVNMNKNTHIVCEGLENQDVLKDIAKVHETECLKKKDEYLKEYLYKPIDWSNKNWMQERHDRLCALMQLANANEILKEGVVFSVRNQQEAVPQLQQPFMINPYQPNKEGVNYVAPVSVAQQAHYDTGNWHGNNYPDYTSPQNKCQQNIYQNNAFTAGNEFMDYHNGRQLPVAKEGDSNHSNAFVGFHGDEQQQQDSNSEVNLQNKEVVVINLDTRGAEGQNDSTNNDESSARGPAEGEARIDASHTDKDAQRSEIGINVSEHQSKKHSDKDTDDINMTSSNDVLLANDELLATNEAVANENNNNVVSDSCSSPADSRNHEANLRESESPSREQTSPRPDPSSHESQSGSDCSETKPESPESMSRDESSLDADESHNKSSLDADESHDKSSLDADESHDKSSLDADESHDKSSLDADESHDKSRLDVDESHDESSSDVDESHDKSRLGVDESHDKSSSDVDESHVKSNLDVDESHDKSSSDVDESDVKSNLDVDESHDKSSLDADESHDKLSSDADESHAKSSLDVDDSTQEYGEAGSESEIKEQDETKPLECKPDSRKSEPNSPKHEATNTLNSEPNNSLRSSLIKSTEQKDVSISELEKAESENDSKSCAISSSVSGELFRNSVILAQGAQFLIDQKEPGERYKMSGKLEELLLIMRRESRRSRVFKDKRTSSDSESSRDSETTERRDDGKLDVKNREADPGQNRDDDFGSDVNNPEKENDKNRDNLEDDIKVGHENLGNDPVKNPDVALSESHTKQPRVKAKGCSNGLKTLVTLFRAEKKTLRAETFKSPSRVTLTPTERPQNTPSKMESKKHITFSPVVRNSPIKEKVDHEHAQTSYDFKAPKDIADYTMSSLFNTTQESNLGVKLNNIPEITLSSLFPDVNSSAAPNLTSLSEAIRSSIGHHLPELTMNSLLCNLNNLSEKERNQLSISDAIRSAIESENELEHPGITSETNLNEGENLVSDLQGPTDDIREATSEGFVVSNSRGPNDDIQPDEPYNNRVPAEEAVCFDNNVDPGVQGQISTSANLDASANRGPVCENQIRSGPKIKFIDLPDITMSSLMCNLNNMCEKLNTDAPFSLATIEQDGITFKSASTKELFVENYKKYQNVIATGLHKSCANDKKQVVFDLHGIPVSPGNVKKNNEHFIMQSPQTSRKRIVSSEVPVPVPREPEVPKPKVRKKTSRKIAFNDNAPFEQFAVINTESQNHGWVNFGDQMIMIPIIDVADIPVVESEFLVPQKAPRKRRTKGKITSDALPTLLPGNDVNINVDYGFSDHVAFTDQSEGHVTLINQSEGFQQSTLDINFINHEFNVGFDTGEPVASTSAVQNRKRTRNRAKSGTGVDKRNVTQRGQTRKRKRTSSGKNSNDVSLSIPNPCSSNAANARIETDSEKRNNNAISVDGDLFLAAIDEDISNMDRSLTPRGQHSAKKRRRVQLHLDDDMLEVFNELVRENTQNLFVHSDNSTAENVQS